jgi:hypothetical protein
MGYKPMLQCVLPLLPVVFEAPQRADKVLRRATAAALPGKSLRGLEQETRGYPFAGHAIHLSVALMLRVRPLTRFWAFLNWRDCALLKMLA